jgi:hypothetical protein
LLLHRDVSLTDVHQHGGELRMFWHCGDQVQISIL